MDFLQQAFVYLVAAVVSVPIANRLGLGSVLGYLIAGIVIGPVLGLIGGAESEDIKHFAEFGVVMMLFLVGLELRPATLWAMRHKLIGLGGLQVGLTALALCAGGLAFGLDWRSALAIGMILALSSTAIVLQTLNEKGLMRSPAGQSAFSVLLFQDIAVIPMLALMPLLANPELLAHASHGADDHGAHGGGLLMGLPGWAQAIAVLVACGGIVVGGRYLIRPVFRFIAQARLREIFTAAALLLVIGIALLMDLVGLSPALGTFLAGVVLSESEYRHELESDIDPFKGLLLGLFFISVGAGINFTLLFGEPGLIVGLALGVMALKFVILFGLAKGFGIRAGDGWLFALSLAQAGEFGFVLVGFAVGSSVLSSAVAAPLTLAIALSMLLTPALFILFERVIAPRMADGEEREPDDITETGVAVVAGIGRFGQIVNRMLRANGYRTVVLDHDAGTIERMRKFGVKSYYGDASRPDLLHATGLDEAKVFIAALDDREKQTEIVHHVHRAHPGAVIIARAYDRMHLYELREAGADIVVREVFESSIDAGRQALVSMGMHPFSAERMARAFRRHDTEMIDTMAEAWNEEGGMTRAYIQTARQAVERLEEVLAADLRGRHDHTERSWAPPPLSTAKPKPEPAAE